MPKYLHEFVMNGSGDYVNETAGEALGKHKLVYRGVDGYWYLADADAATTMPVLGITMSEIAATRKGEILLEGYIGDTSWTWTGGGEVYASTTAGEITQTMPTGAGDVVQVVAIAVEATIIQFTGKAGNALYASNTLEGETAFVGFDASKSHYVNYFLVDGTADNIQIQLALDYVNGLGGGSVLLEAGTYDISTNYFSIYGDIDFKGCGDATVLRIADGANLTRIIRLYQSNVRVMNLKLDGNRANQTDGAGGLIYLGLSSVNHEILNCTIVDGYDHGIYIAFGELTEVNTLIHNCKLSGHGTGGVNFIYTKGGRISDCEIHDVAKRIAQHGIQILSSEDITITGNLLEVDEDGNHNIYVSGSNNVTITGNVCRNPVTDSIYDNVTVRNSFNVTISANSIYGGVPGIAVAGACSQISVIGNTIYNTVSAGINVDSDTGNISHVSIIGNTIHDPGQGGALLRDGIYIDDGANQITHVVLEDNIIDNPTRYGINLVSGTGIIIKATNRITNTVSGVLFDGGTDTILSYETFQFIKEVNGTYLTASPTGVEIDATTEGAILQGHIPSEVQSIQRIIIYAVALAAPIGAGGQMHLEVTFNAGSPNASYSTAAKSWTLANWDSEEADYVNGDVVTWVIENADVGNKLDALAAGDKFELIVTHEAGADPDGETDAVFGSLEVEYV